MLSPITKKTTNPQQEQGDNSVKSTAKSEQDLFAQFTDILDKIASSLGHAKKSNDNQVVSDMSAALGQAAAFHLARPAQVERVSNQPDLASKKDLPIALKPTNSASENAVTSSSNDGASLTKNESRPVVDGSKAQGVSANTPAPATDQAQTESAQQQSTVSADPQGQDAQLEQSVQGQQQLELAGETEMQVTVTDETNPPVSGEESTQAEQNLIVQSETSEAATGAVVADTDQSSQPAQAASSALNNPKELEAKEVAEQVVQGPVSKTEQVAQVEEPSEQATNQEIKAQTTAPESDESQQFSEHQKIAQAQAKTASGKTNEELLVQSIEALLQQVAFAGGAKQVVEAVLSSKGASHGHPIQGIQASGNSQLIGAQSDSTKQLQPNRDKPTTRELPRHMALRTMERVESALKEVARSKDGKTISLRLDPPSLGTLKIDVSLKDGQLHARFVGESAQVNALLREQSHELQLMLRKAGIQAEKIIITVGNDRATDFKEGFQTFDQQASQQFRDSATRQGGFSAGTQNGGSESLGTVQIQRPVDHWVA